MLFKKKQNNSKINASSINAISLSADIIHTNSEFGHFGIADYEGKTFELKTNNYILTFMGGILINVKKIGGE